MKTLVIAEKPSVASDLAKVLGVKKDGDWFENDRYVISSAVGHLLELAVPEEHEIKRGKWTMEKLPHIPPEFTLAPIDKNASRLALLRRLIKRKEVGELINACDAGREGELIFRNIVKATGAKQPIKRLWLQSMTPDAIRTAFSHLRSDADMQPLADAAVSRSESDWLVGINSTRALTAFNSQGGGFSKTTAGRVQTPTLAILVEREEKIRAFEPRAYWEVFGDFGVAAGNYRGRWFDATFKKNADEDARAERIWDKSKADAIKAKCDGQPGTVEEEKKPTTQAPPLLYDLTTLQREANQRHGFPAKMTLQIAQALYEKHKALTYPRTDSRYLPEDHVSTAKQVMGSFEDRTLAGHAERALREGWVRPGNKRIFNNAKVSDHFAIVPTGTAPKNLSETEQKIFEMVSRRFVAVFFPAAQFEVTTRITTVKEEKFKTDGKIIIDPGWLAVYGRQAEGEGENDRAIVAIVRGEPARTEAIEVKENVTKPAPRYTEATLLSAMEGAGKLVDDEELREAMSERGLGTPATRAQVIEGLIFEGYLIRDGRDLVVTAKGISLITLLRNLHAETLTKPELTGEWEHKLRQMERGQLSRDAFMTQIRDLTTEIVAKVRGGMGQEVRGNFKPIDVKCPKCGSGPFRESFKAFECTNAECKLIVWKTMSGREFERDEVAKLLTEGRVGPLEGFRSKLGRAFNAEIILSEKTEWKQKFDFEDEGEGGEGSGKTIDLSKAQLLGETPNGNVYETEKTFVCQPAGSGKSITMGKSLCQRAIPAEQALKIFREGKSDLLPRFISKKGKPFAAYLKLEGTKVTFEFEPRKKKEPAKKALAKTEA